MRLQAGYYYPAYGPRTPKAMAELVDAGLVESIGRATVYMRCFVPKNGYVPMITERWNPEEFDKPD